ncbi:hypothetical protein LTR66_011390 [Elasticomyces elasticus]|nr:hypothetical protein LTR66_011390 [Elasticomyces elasticus]KAK5009879.1 hypothetical protein LTR28_012944 [Elasticomyces elasticus]
MRSRASTGKKQGEGGGMEKEELGIAAFVVLLTTCGYRISADLLVRDASRKGPNKRSSSKASLDLEEPLSSSYTTPAEPNAMETTESTKDTSLTANDATDDTDGKRAPLMKRLKTTDLKSPDTKMGAHGPVGPVQRVFGTTELLELILLSLPRANLLRVQQVCGGFKSVIAGSIAIQRALFLRPVPHGLIHWSCRARRTDAVTPRLHPCPFGKYHWGFWRTADGAKTEKQPVFNPLVFNNLTRWEGRLEAFGFNLSNCSFPCTAYCITRIQRRSPRLHHSHHSWEDMLITQPPCAELRMTLLVESDIMRYGLCLEKSELEIRITSATGITMGQVQRECQRRLTGPVRELRPFACWMVTGCFET